MSKNSTFKTVKLARYHCRIADPYNKTFYTEFEAFVLKPTYSHPFPCIMVSIRNGREKLFFRVIDLKGLRTAFKIPRTASQRLNLALATANIEADDIEKDMKLAFARRRLAFGHIVRTDTGEILAEADRILEGNKE